MGVGTPAGRSKASGASRRRGRHGPGVRPCVCHADAAGKGPPLPLIWGRALSTGAFLAGPVCHSPRLAHGDRGVLPGVSSHCAVNGPRPQRPFFFKQFPLQLLLSGSADALGTFPYHTFSQGRMETRDTEPAPTVPGIHCTMSSCRCKFPAHFLTFPSWSQSKGSPGKAGGHRPRDGRQAPPAAVP